MEAELKLPGGGSKLVVVAGQPLDINEDDCMLFTFTDLEPRRQAESALRESEERFAKAFRLSPVPTLLCTAHERRVLDVNEAFTRTTEYDAEALIGKTVDEIQFIDDPEANRRLFAALEKAVTSKGWTSGCARRERVDRLRGLGRCRQHSQCALLPAGAHGHYRTQTLGAGAGERHRRSDAGRFLVQPNLN